MYIQVINVKNDFYLETHCCCPYIHFLQENSRRREKVWDIMYQSSVSSQKEEEASLTVSLISKFLLLMFAGDFPQESFLYGFRTMLASFVILVTVGVFVCLYGFLTVL